MKIMTEKLTRALCVLCFATLTLTGGCTTHGELNTQDLGAREAAPCQILSSEIVQVRDQQLKEDIATGMVILGALASGLACANSYDYNCGDNVIAGGALGGVAGIAVGHAVSLSPAHSYLVKTERGVEKVITAIDAEAPPLSVGETCFLVRAGTRTQVIQADHDAFANKPPVQSSASGEIVFAKRGDGHYYALITIAGKKFEGLIDTGATSLALPPYVFKHLVDSNQIGEIDEGKISTATGEQKSIVGNVRRVGIQGISGGPVFMNDVAVTTVDGLDSILVGMSVLDNFNVAIKSDTLRLTTSNEY